MLWPHWSIRTVCRGVMEKHVSMGVVLVNVESATGALTKTIRIPRSKLELDSH